MQGGYNDGLSNRGRSNWNTLNNASQVMELILEIDYQQELTALQQDHVVQLED